ncbi:MAG: hypothetical protein HY547_01475 [Elusimicrobia bacterium]|nr:hypothetical protein [Elusimicrobiota bacterium]
MNTSRFIMPAFRFGVHDLKEAIKLIDAGVCGFCLYGGKAHEVAALTRKLRAHAGKPLLFASDFENGAGSQISDMTEMVSNMGIGRNNNLDNARLKGNITAAQAKLLGINWIFAPVIDLHARPDNPIVSIRSFGSDPKIVAKLADAFLENLEKNRVASCLKHFPGHGDTRVDSHLELARIERPLAKLEKNDWQPYRALISKASSVMSCHLIQTEIDSLPASLSERWIKNILRQKLGFGGVVITDALMMGAIVQNFSEKDYLRLGLIAGNDILLYPPEPWSAIKTLNSLYEKKFLDQTIFNAASTRIERLLGRLEDSAAGAMPAANDFLNLESIHQKSALKLAHECLAWPHGRARHLPWPAGPLRYLEVGNKKTDFIPSGEFWSAKTVGLAVRQAKPALRHLIASMHDKAHLPSFAKILASSGFDLKPPQNARYPKAPLLIGIFHKPRAFSGVLGLEPQDIEKINAALAVNPRVPSLAIAFGDPETINQLPSTLTALATFSDSPNSQLAALKILTTAFSSAKP